MNYQQTLDYLYEQLPMFQRDGQQAYKANLDNTHALDHYFCHPHQDFKTVHVAGTNGKGSTSHMLASILQEAGYRVGLYTSPHLIDFRERIRINGAMISKDYVVDFVERYRSYFEGLKPSFFELTVAMAFLYFKEQHVDVAIIETGLGGRLDSTNIITPITSIITNISLDHVALLGDTIESIAQEKAGIIKHKIPVVLGKTNRKALEVFEKKALEMEAPIVSSSSVQLGKFENEYTWITPSETQTIHLSLSGDYQYENLRTVLAALPSIATHFEFSNEQVLQALSKVQQLTGLQGRWQVLGEMPYTVCDTGHNEDGITAVIQQINRCFYQHLHLVFGVANDKDLQKILPLLPKEATYYFTQANIPRALDFKTLQTEAQAYQLKGMHYATVADAYQAAQQAASPDDMIFVGGSSFVVGDLLSTLKPKPTPPSL